MVKMAQQKRSKGGKEATESKKQAEEPEKNVVAGTVVAEQVIVKASGPLKEEAEIVKADEIVAAEERIEKKSEAKIDLSRWTPKTSLGKQVKEGSITDIEQVFAKGEKILEGEIVDMLVPNFENDLLMIGQSKGKFGGGKRRAFRQTQKKTKEGNKPNFATMAIIGNRDGYIGVGYGKAKETVPAREKAFRRAKLNIMMIKRGCGSWQCNCKMPHSVPFAVTGKSGSTVVKLMPAPKGTGMCVEKEIGKILALAGIKDVWSKTLGHTATKMNMINATMDALEKLSTAKVSHKAYEELSIVEGKAKPKQAAE
jgi:small subunit ribosomal protein S5